MNYLMNYIFFKYMKMENLKSKNKLNNGKFKYQNKNNIKLLKRIILKGNENKNINDFSFNKTNLNNFDNDDEKNISLKLNSNYNNSSFDSEDSLEKNIKLKKIKIKNGEEEINFLNDNEVKKNKQKIIKTKRNKNITINKITNNNNINSVNDFDFGKFLRKYSLKYNNNQIISKIKNEYEDNKDFGVIKINKTKTLSENNIIFTCGNDEKEIEEKSNNSLIKDIDLFKKKENIENKSNNCNKIINKSNNINQNLKCNKESYNNHINNSFSLIEKLKKLDISLLNESELFPNHSILNNDIEKNNSKSFYNNKEIIITNINGDNFNYPNYYYINNPNLHNKIHISKFFSIYKKHEII